MKLQSEEFAVWREELQGGGGDQEEEQGDVVHARGSALSDEEARQGHGQDGARLAQSYAGVSSLSLSLTIF